jgi:nucleoside-diphosphate-sugar epimerase
MDLRGMRVFITGATGFVGGALARALVQHGADVHALARPTADRTALDGLPVTWHNGDVTLPESLDGCLSRSTWIIHAAGRLGQAGVPYDVYHRINVEGTRNVLSAALRYAQTRVRVLHVSTPGVLGRTTQQPATEDSPYAPNNHYERSKAAAEQIALEFAKRGLPVIVARPGFIYGPGDHHVLNLFRAIHSGRFFYINGGRHLCHPTYIADVVDGLMLCLQRGRVGEAYHFTGPRPVTFRELGETIAAALAVPFPRFSVPAWCALPGAAGLEALGRVLRRTPPLSRTGVDFFSADRVFSWEKAHHELGYTPQYDLSAGVVQTVRWYRQHGWL